ncbi:hypothetical protein [Burkholderia cenocepacia]|uniref:hypothetical protein n=1 Tax=Burkholderia cenocepacia TaxID=95486 RepID=UPI0011782E22|nr:hypothetical protein [Burkholderia cenocepacia]
MSSNSYVNLKIATCLVRYADDRLIDQRFPKCEKMLDRASGLERERLQKGAARLAQPVRETLINEPVVRITDEAGCNFQIDVGI